jgi:hypothetical protein
MRQQIAERDWTRGLVGLIERTIRVAQHAHARQLGCALRDGLVEMGTPFVEQRQRRDGRDRFRQRGDADDRVALNGRFGHKIAPPDCCDLTDRSVSPDKRGGPGKLPGLDFWQERLLDRILPRHRSGPRHGCARSRRRPRESLTIFR